MTMIGKYLEDRFRVEDLVGEGGMSTVYRAVEVYSGLDVAVKVLRKDAADPSYRERFLREAQSQATLSHPNVAKIFHFGRDLDHGVLYIAMEYVSGDHLGTLLDVGQIPLNLALDVTYQICNGLTEAHNHGIVHRDLKPANIMLRPKRQTTTVKLLDFGFARTLHTESTLTAQGKIVGTLSYIAPEQLLQAPLDVRVDIYTLGILLFEMLTGRLPLAGETPQATAMMHISLVPPSLSEFLPDAHPHLIALVDAMLSKSPDDRPDLAYVAALVAQFQDELGLTPFQPGHIGPSSDVCVDWGVTTPVADG